MRGLDHRGGAPFSWVDLEKRVPQGHPLRVIRGIANVALGSMSGGFGAHYASGGRPSIPPEMLRRALLLQAFHGVRSERQPMERLDFDLLLEGVAREDGRRVTLGADKECDTVDFVMEVRELNAAPHRA